MANSSKKAIEEFLDESFESDISNVYDSDADPEYRPGENNTNINFAGPSQSLELTSADDPSADESFSESSSDSSDDEPIDNSNLWVNNYLDIPDFGFNSDSIGIKLEINESARDNPIEIFKQIWTDEITEIFVTSINKYGENMSLQCRPHNKGSRNTHFKRTTSEEVQHVLAACLLGGSIQFSVVRDMFSNNPLYYHPIAGHIMSGRRFEKLCRCFSVEYANDTNPLVGPMKKLYPVFDILVWRQYIKGKKAKYGIKFYELCTQDGYVLNVDMYKGKQTSSAVEEGVSKKKKTHTTGTLRSNRRGNPKEVTTKKLKRGDHIWRRNKYVYVSKWKDKRDVLCLTTKNHPKIIPSKNKYGILKNKPAEIVDYNNYMSGIDRSDQMVSYYSSPRKSARWYKKCYKTKIRKQTSLQCKVCGKPLCPGKCFEEWHNHNQ
ncbi:piggyBac transposable element-derived protein 4-like [Melanaphis sacchari]|uniref:piggyBac transposable element-derived protein 4-like n=1 Tax=Melanaphis sacchari TaxID=742174 RepID=UPI000DC152B0|nr:piggyBac transposable element-derived protein 4-like [Melanaphis sacchari]